MHSGFKVTEVHRCDICNFRREVQYVQSMANPTKKRKRGAPSDHLGDRIIHAAYSAGVNNTQVGELFDQAGTVRASSTGLQKYTKRRKVCVREAAEIQLRKNRIEPNKAILDTYGASRIVEFSDSSGKTHRYMSGPISADGAGETRAYNHRITGKQHCTVIMSGLTKKPLAIKHHQKSCCRCNRRISELILEGKKGQDITAADLEHDGECYRNTSLSPTQAEEPAMEELGEYLLIDPETGLFRPDNEGVLALEVITDGDTKGAKRLIAKQAQLVPEFSGKAEQFPDIGHFIKMMSGGLFKLRETNPERRGAQLLENDRIKTICADTSKKIRKFGSDLNALDSSLPDHEATVKKLRDDAIKSVASIIPHHCGDHSNCGADCNYKIIESKYIDQYSVEPQGKLVSDE